MRSLGKLTGLMLASVIFCHVSLAVPNSLADEPGLLKVSVPASITTDLRRLEDRLGQFQTELLSLQHQPLEKTLEGLVFNHGLFEVHLVTDNTTLLPHKIELRWDTIPVKAVEYTDRRQSALSQGAADILLAVQTSPGNHTLEIRYHTDKQQKELTFYKRIFPIQKKNVMTVLLLKPKDSLKGIVLEYEVLELRLPAEKERLLDLNYRNALFYFYLGQFPKTVGIVSSSLKFQEDPAQRAELLFLLGKTYLKWGYESQAIQIFLEIMDKAPRKDRILPKVKYYLQKAQYRRGQFDAVTSIYTRDGRGFAPLDQPEMHYLAGQSFLHQKNYASAISAFIQIPRGNDYYPFALYSLGLAYRGFGDTFAAQQAFHKLIERDPEDHPRLARLIERSSLTLGLMLLEQSRYREAIAVLQELSVQSDFFAQALFGIGWSYMKLEEYVKAIVAFGDLIERRPESQFAQEGRLVKGYCYSKLRAYGKAVDHYRKVLEISSHQISSLTQEMHTLQQGGTDLSLIRASVRLNTVEDRQDLFRAIEKYEELTHLLSSEQSAGPQATQRNTQMKTQFQAFETQFAFILKEMALQTLQERREWFEDLSVHAGIGIAKNLTLEKTEFGGKELILDY